MAASPASSAAAAAASGTPIKIGWLVSTTGVYASIGADMTNGFDLYLASVKNTAGGRPIQVIKADEGPGDPKVALEQARKMLEQDKVDILGGIIASNDALAIAPVAIDAKVITVVANAGANDITGKAKNKFIFRTAYANAQLSIAAAPWIAKNVAPEAAIVAADYAAGHEIMDAFKETYTKAGGKIVKEYYPPLGATDFAAYLSDMKNVNPKMVYVFQAGASAPAFVKQYTQFGLKGSIPLVGAFLTTSDVLPAEGQNAVGVKDMLYYSPQLDNAANKQFVSDYKAKYNRGPSVFSVASWDAGQVIVKGIDAVKGDLSDKDKLISAMANLQFDSPRGPFKFDTDSHNPIQHFYALEVKDVNGELQNTVLADLGTA